MKPEDFGITQYKMLSSGKMEILQHVKMNNLNLEEFPFEVERLNGYLDLSNNKIKNTKSLLFPIMGDNIKLSNNSITDIDEFLEYHDSVKHLALYQNALTYINIPKNFGDGLLNLFGNNLNQITFVHKYWEGAIYFEKIKDYTKFPKYIKLMSVRKLNDLDFKEFPQFSELLINVSSIKNFTGSPISVKRVGLYNCKIDSMEDFPYMVEHNVTFRHCHVQNFNYQFSPNNKNRFIDIKESFVYKSSNYIQEAEKFDNYQDFQDMVKSSIILKNL